MDIFDESTHKYNAQNPQTLKNILGGILGVQFFPPTSFHTFFCTSTSIKVLFQILQKLRFSYSTSATDTFG